MNEYEFELEGVTKKGAQVKIKWKLKKKNEEETEQQREATYTKPEDMTWTDFRDMIVLEEKAMKKHIQKQLEQQEKEEDITTEFSDLK